MSVTNGRPRILLVADVPGWIFERHCGVLRERLAGDFAFDVTYCGRPFREADYDLIYPLAYGLVPRSWIRSPERWLTGIRSHRCAREVDFFELVDFLATSFQRVHAISQTLVGMYRPFLPDVALATNGVDETFFTPTTRADRWGRKLRLGWAGNRTYAGKGFDDLVRPLARLPGVELVVCGYVDRLLDLAGMRYFYDSVDAVVCASESEGASNVVLEAAAMQRAIITTRVGIVPELLEHEKNALIVERELASLVEAVVRLRDRPDERAALGANARAAVVERFPWSKVIEQYRAFFRQALDGAPRWRPPPSAVARAVGGELAPAPPAAAPRPRRPRLVRLAARGAGWLHRRLS
jgi:glycosyltransferase involved in cell wall biosynthesis